MKEGVGTHAAFTTWVRRHSGPGGAITGRVEQVWTADFYGAIILPDGSRLPSTFDQSQAAAQTRVDAGVQLYAPHNCDQCGCEPWTRLAEGAPDEASGGPMAGEKIR